MTALREVQASVARAVRHGLADGADGLIEGDGISAAGRLAVYRNHFLISLADPLATTFPVVLRLVGEPFFRAAARRFVQEQPPRSPCIAEYGGGFPVFLACLPEAAGLAYLADVARLEWALVVAAEAADTPPLPPERLATLDPRRLPSVRLTLQPALCLLASAFPIDRIWRANQGCGEPRPIALADGGVRLLVHRGTDAVGWTALPAADFTFVAALAAGLVIGDAAERAAGDSDGFDPAAAFGLLLANGLIVDASLDPMEEVLP